MSSPVILDAEVSAVEMTPSCARDLTARINSTAEDLAGMLQRARDERAWKALGYENWTAYCSAEITVSQRRVFQLLDFAEIREQVNPGSVELLTEKSARQLKRVTPAKRAEVFSAAVERSSGTRPSAKAVETVVVEILAEPGAGPDVPSISYVPAVGLGIADNAIRMLGTIIPSDSQRLEAAKKVTDWINRNLAPSKSDKPLLRFNRFWQTTTYKDRYAIMQRLVEMYPSDFRRLLDEKACLHGAAHQGDSK